METISTFDLIKFAQNGDKDAFNTLVKDNSGLIWSVVKRFIGRGVETDDLYQLGCVGFIKAVARYDSSFGTCLSTYAVPMIYGEIRRFLRDDGIIKVSRSTKETSVKVNRARRELEIQLGHEPTLNEISKKTGLDVEEIAMCETAVSPVSSLQQTLNEDGFTMESVLGDDGIEDEIVEHISLGNAIKKLNQKEQKIIYLRFYKGLTQSNTAKVLDISQVQVSRLERKAIANLRKLIV